MLSNSNTKQVHVAKATINERRKVHEIDKDQVDIKVTAGKGYVNSPTESDREVTTSVKDPVEVTCQMSDHAGLEPNALYRSPSTSTASLCASLENLCTSPGSMVKPTVSRVDDRCSKPHALPYSIQGQSKSSPIKSARWEVSIKGVSPELDLQFIVDYLKRINVPIIDIGYIYQRKNSSAFRVEVTRQNYDKLFNPKLWGPGITVSKYNKPKTV